MIIEVWSDVVCPWCFIGRKRLQKAIAKLSNSADVHVIHRAFQLQPNISSIIPTVELLSKNYQISPEQVSEMQSQVCLIAEGEGLCYQLANTYSGNTVDAHRLLLWAQQSGGADSLIEVMYSAYFEKNERLFSHDELMTLVARTDLNVEEALALLNSDDFRNEVQSDQELARRFGASGVPFYVVDQKYAISGAQPQAVFDETLERAYEDSRS